MKGLIARFRMMSTAKKVEIFTATMLTLTIIVGVPVFAWLTTTTKVEVLTKIKEPEQLDIRAGNGEDVFNFDLRDIDFSKPDDVNGTKKSKYYVFSVNPGAIKFDYIIQVAHTTNIPLTYKLYSAKKTEGNTVSKILYHPILEPNNITYYEIVRDDIPDTYDNLLIYTLNSDDGTLTGRQLGQKGDEDGYYNQTYTDSSDTPEIYAIPVYQQTDVIKWEQNNPGELDYYVLELEWDDNPPPSAEDAADPESTYNRFKQWNTAINNKETDIVYISAAKATTA